MAFARLEGEVDAADGPLHPLVAIRQPPFSADGSLGTPERPVEAREVGGSRAGVRRSHRQGLANPGFAETFRFGVLLHG